jgi:hypothetical protein
MINWGILQGMIIASVAFIFLFSWVLGRWCFKSAKPLSRKIYCTLLTIPIAAGVANSASKGSSSSFIVEFIPWIIATLIVISIHWLYEKFKKTRSS